MSGIDVSVLPEIAVSYPAWKGFDESRKTAFVQHKIGLAVRLSREGGEMRQVVPHCPLEASRPLPRWFRLTGTNRASIIAIRGKMKSGSRQNMAEPAAPKLAEDDLLRMTAEVVSAYVSNNTLATG